MALTVTIDGVDVTDKVRLEDWRFEMAADQGQVGTGRLTVDDTTGVADWAPLATEWSAVESTATPTTIAGGFIGERATEKKRLKAGVQREFVPIMEDWNTALTDRVFKGSGSDRPAETDYQRINWLCGQGVMSMLDGNGKGKVPNDNTVEMDATDYRGKTPLDVLDDCAEASDKNFYLYYVDGTGWMLFYDAAGSTDAEFTSSLKISDDPSDIDSSTVFGASDIDYVEDPERIYSGMLVKWASGWVWVTNGTTEAAYRRLHITVIKENIKKASRARQWATRQLAKLNEPTKRLEMTVSVPGSALGELRAGMRIQVKLRSRGITAYTYWRIASITIQPRTARRGVSDVEYDVRLHMKDRIRPVNLDDTFGGGDSSGNDGTGANEPPGGDSGGDTGTTEYPVTKFPHTSTTGDAVDGDAFSYVAQQGYRSVFTDLGAYVSYSAGNGDAHTNDVGSSSGVLQYPWTNRPAWTSCGGLDGVWVQPRDQGMWGRWTVGAHATNAAGVKVTFFITPSDAWGIGKRVQVYATSAAPTTPEGGTYCGSGTLVSGGGYITVTVPQSAVPADGGTLWVGVIPLDVAERGVYYCGNATAPGYVGADGSWRSQIQAPGDWTLTWQALEDDGWGTLSEGEGVDTDASWEGGNTWTELWSDASTFTGTGSAGVWTAESDGASGGMALYSAAEDNGSDEPWGPWSDGSMDGTWCFTVNALGDTADTDPNRIEFGLYTSAGSNTAIVHLGDAVDYSYMDPDQQRGIALATGLTTPTYAFAAKAMTTSMCLRFDASGSNLRAKLWPSADPEPVDWDVTLPKDFESPGEYADFYIRTYGNADAVYSFSSWDASPATLSGTVVQVLPPGNGASTTWTIHPWVAGTLTVWVDGIRTAPLSVDRDNGTFTFDRPPANGAVIRVEYEPR